MRKLKTSDVFTFCRCLKALGVKASVQAIAKEANATRDIWDRGFDLVWQIFDAATETGGEQELYVFLSGPFEMTPQDVAGLDVADLFANLKRLAEDNDLVNFFGSVSKLMK